MISMAQTRLNHQHIQFMLTSEFWQNFRTWEIATRNHKYVYDTIPGKVYSFQILKAYSLMKQKKCTLFCMVSLVFFLKSEKYSFISSK